MVVMVLPTVSEDGLFSLDSKYAEGSWVGQGGIDRVRICRSCERRENTKKRAVHGWERGSEPELWRLFILRVKRVFLGLVYIVQ